MKNLILPFVVVALFVFGGCGDDNLVSNSVEKPKFHQITGGNITVENIPCTIKESLSDGYGQHPDRIFDSQISWETDFSQHSDSSNIINNDTLTMIRETEVKKDTTFGIRKFRTTVKQSTIVNIVLDTISHTLPYLNYRYSMNESSGYMTDELHYSSGSSYDYNNYSITLTNVPYIQVNDSLIITLKQGESHLIGQINYSEYSKSGSSSNSGKSWDWTIRETRLTKVLPFKEVSSIRIALQYMKK